MNNVVIDTGRQWRAAVFSVVTRRQTYRNVLYLLSSLPLGVVYVILVVPGLVSCVGMAMLVGVPLFLLLSAVWWRAAAFERRMTTRWLGVTIVPPERPGVSWTRPLARLFPLGRMFSPVTWKIIGYLLLKLPFGIAAFTVTVTFIALTLGLILLPASYLIDTLLYRSAPDVHLRVANVVVDGRLSIVALAELLILAAAGAVLLAVTLHLLNLIAFAWGRFARLMLGVNPLALRLVAAQETAAREQARAARADQSRRELIVNVSHELRTPIASIRGHVESLLMALDDAQGEGSPAVDEQQAYLGIVYRETERLGALVDDLLSLARVDAGELRLELAPVAAGEVIEEVHRSMAPLARRERQVTVVCDVASDLPLVLADRARLAQVVLNLVRNAVTYTPAGGIVSIGLHLTDGGRLALTVADTGVGIAPEDLEHIFEWAPRPSGLRWAGRFGGGRGARSPTDCAGLDAAGHGRPGGLSSDPATAPDADHHADGAVRGDRPRAGPGGGGGRLYRQAL